MDFSSWDAQESERTRTCPERLSGESAPDHNDQCRTRGPVRPSVIKSGFFDEVRWWCFSGCQRWLEESAFRLSLIMNHPSLLLVLCASAIFRIAGCCSSRSTPRPRPPTPTHRPNITFQTYACPEAYAKWYCLNGATCFSVKIDESILYNCECANGYVGQRCEFKDLEGSYLASRQQVMIETASIAGGATFLILILVILSVAVYVHYKRKRKGQAHLRVSQSYQPFGSFRDSETNGITRPLRSTDPESGRPSHGDVTHIGSSDYSASNRARTAH